MFWFLDGRRFWIIKRKSLGDFLKTKRHCCDNIPLVDTQFCKLYFKGTFEPSLLLTEVSVWKAYLLQENLFSIWDQVERFFPGRIGWGFITSCTQIWINRIGHDSFFFMFLGFQYWREKNCTWRKTAMSEWLMNEVNISVVHRIHNPNSNKY